MFLEELEDLKNRLPGPLPARQRAVARGAGRRAVPAAGSTASGSSALTRRPGAGRHGRRVVPLRTVRHGAGAAALLTERGVDPHHVHHEMFHVDGRSHRTAAGRAVVDAGAPPEAVVTVNLDGRTTVIPMPSREETILDATLRARPDAPYSLHRRRLRHLPRAARRR